MLNQSTCCGGIKKIWITCYLFFFISCFNTVLLGQTSPQNAANALAEPVFLTLEPSSLLLLPIAYSGMSETAATTVEQELLVGLNNLGRFVLYPLTDLLEEDEQLDMQCQNPICGQTLGIKWQKDLVMLTTIDRNATQNYLLTVHLFDPISGQTLLMNTYQAKERNAVYMQFFADVKNRSYVVGQIEKTTETQVILSLGSYHGLKSKDSVVVYRPLAGAENIDDREQSLRTIIAILKIEQVARQQSIAKVTHSFQEPMPYDRVKMVVNQTLQKQMIKQARFDIDQAYARSTKTPDYVSLFPPVQEATSETVTRMIPLYDIADRENWIKKVRYWERQREIHRWIMIGGAAATVGVYFADQSNSALSLLSLGVTAYGAYFFLDAREQWNKAVDEGKYRGFLPLQWLEGTDIPPARQPVPDEPEQKSSSRLNRLQPLQQLQFTLLAWQF